MSSTSHAPIRSRLPALGILAVCVALALPLGAQEPAGAPPADPDSLTLDNGDRLLGKLLSLASDELSFESPVLGELQIPTDKVRDVHTTGSVHLVLKSGESFDLPVLGLADGKLSLGGAASPRTLELNALETAERAEYPAWSGSIAAGGTIATGNTNIRTGNVSAKAKRRSAIDRITFGFSWDYADDEDRATDTLMVTQRRIGGGAQYDFFLGEKSYLLANFAAEADEFQDLDLRLTTGVGAGYQFVESHVFELSGEGGISYYREDFTVGTDKSYPAARVAYGVEWNPFEFLSLMQDANYLPSLESSSDYYLRFDTRARVPMVAGLFTQLQWILEYNSTPAPGLERTDQRFILAVGWEF